MSQSPEDNADEGHSEQLLRYRNAWSALSQLIGQGRSFSGKERNCFFLNSRDGKFTEAAAAFGIDFNDDGRAVVITDWNFDGAPDLWLSNRTAPRVRILLNQCQTQNNWVRLKLRGIVSNRDAIGARVTIVTSSPRQTLVRTVRAGDGFLSQSSKWLHFGLGKGSPEKVVVRWPNGDHEEIRRVAANAHFKIQEGSGTAIPWVPQLSQNRLDESSFTDNSAAPPPTNTRTWILGRVPLIHVGYRTIGSTTASLDDLRGQPLLVNLWSKSCAPCWQELREWTRAEEQFRDANCQVIALSVDRLAEVEPISLEAVNWPYLAGEATADLLDGLETLQRAFIEFQNPLPVPSSFLLDKSGQLAAIYQGKQTSDNILRDVAMLDQPGSEQRQAAVPFPGRWASEVFPSSPFPVVQQLEMQGKPDLATSYLARFVAFSSADTGPLVALVQRMLAQQQYSTLHPLLFQLRKLAAEDAALHRGLGYQLMQNNLFQESLNHFEVSLRAHHSDPVLHYNAGMAAVGAKQLPRAIDLLTRAAKLAPDDVTTQYQLAKTLQATNRLSESLRHFANAYRLRPNWPPAANGLAWILSTAPDASLRDGVRAKQIMEPVCRNWRKKQNNIHPSILGTYAAALAECAEFELAIAVLSRAKAKFQEMGMSEQGQQLEDYTLGLKRGLPIRMPAP